MTFEELYRSMLNRAVTGEGAAPPEPAWRRLARQLAHIEGDDPLGHGLSAQDIPERAQKFLLPGLEPAEQPAGFLPGITPQGIAALPEPG